MGVEDDAVCWVYAFGRSYDVRIVGWSELSESGMSGLHSQSEAYLEWMKKEKVPLLSGLSPEEARTWDARVAALLTKTSQWSGTIRNMRVQVPSGDLNVRVYVPNSHASRLLLYYHGGGWVLGNLDQVEYPTRLLATETDRIVVSVDYRLAPEHKFPSAVDDCYFVSKWFAENPDKIGATKEKMAVCGDSAGGNLAACVCLMAKDRHGPSIANQILIYPVTDLSDQNYKDYPDDLSPALTRADMNWFIRHYVSGSEDLWNQYASPILRDDLTELPAALIITAEYDILTKQCNAYADRLKRAGVRVKSINYPGLVHGFFTLPDVFDAAQDTATWIAKELANP